MPHLSSSKVEVPEEETRDVVFAPNPGPQTEFLASPEKEVLYGGAAGGGKTYALIADPLRYVQEKDHWGLILRRTNDELREMIFKTQEMYPKAFPGAKWSEQRKEWTFPSGARLWMTYLERDEDVLRYQGQSFTYIGVDELTQYRTPFAWNYLRSRLRSTNPNIKTYMRATTNPGGPGHVWVKKMFIDPAPPGQAFDATDIETGQVLLGPDGQPLFKRRFIPARLHDNPYLSDTDYLLGLMSLPEQQRKQLLEGSWDVADGAAFPEFNRAVHTCDPFRIPDDWMRWRGADYGYSSYSGVLWFAKDPNTDVVYVYRELYVSKQTGFELANTILRIEGKEPVQFGVLDSSCWHQRGQFGPSIADQMISAGVRWRQADRSRGSRTAGKNELHRLLQVREDGNPGLIFFNTCTNLIAQFPSIPLDKNNVEDVDTKSEDHLYDALRYGVMARPKPRGIWEIGVDNGSPASSWRPVDPIFGY